jgi:hypothetical protein
LNTFRAQAALTYGADGKIVLTGGYFNTWGSSDTLLFANNRTFSPNSDGFTAEVAFQFFGNNNAPKICRGSIAGSAYNTSPTTSSTAPRPIRLHGNQRPRQQHAAGLSLVRFLGVLRRKPIPHFDSGVGAVSSATDASLCGGDYARQDEA